MPDLLEIDLIASSKIAPSWIPRFLHGPNCWRVISGNWNADHSDGILCLKKPKIRPDENILVSGSEHWRDIRFTAGFKIMTPSIDPPQGGVILYFRLKDIKNYYSFHFCLSKQRVEFIKRINGEWITTAGHDFDLQLHQDYKVSIESHDNRHQCRINEKALMDIQDEDISRGCIGIGAKFCGVDFNRATVSVVQ